MDFGADHAESFSAWIDVVKAGFDSLDILSEFLIDAVVGLGDGFVGIIDTAAENTRDPGSEASTALAPAVKAGAVEG